MTDLKKIDFGISTIRVLGFSFFDPRSTMQEFNLENAPIEAKIKINYKWNIEKDLFGVVVDFLYAFKHKNDSLQELVKLSVITEFKINNLKDNFVVRTSNDFDIDLELETTIVGIAISTARGILFEKASGTIFKDVVFPIINTSEVILSKKFKLNK